MLTMTEKTLLGLAITLSIVCAGIIVLPAFSYEVSLVTSPNSANFFVPAGEPFNITCKGSGDDAEKFSGLKWLNKKGEVIPEGFPGTLEVEKNSLTLIFIDPKEDESGVYKCMAVYENKDTLQKSVSIIFHGSKPLFDDSFEDVTSKENSYLEMPCSANGDLPITYEWYNKNEERLPTISDPSVIVTETLNNTSVLIIPTVRLNHAGAYTCLARNSHGLSSKIFELTVLPEGDSNDTTNGTASFRDAQVVNVTARSVKFAFDVTGPVKYIEVKFQLSRTDTEYFRQFKYGGDYEIDNLNPAGLYYFSFRTIPSANGQWSKSYRVVLLPDKPEVIFRTIDSGTVKLQWLFKFDDRMRGTIDRHEITYFTVQMVGGISWKPSDCAITIEIPSCGSTSHTISGLSKDVYYEIQLRAHTAAGYGEPYTQKFLMSTLI